MQRHADETDILNEVLSLNAQELPKQDCPSFGDVLNEVLSLNAQEFNAPNQSVAC